MNNFIVLLFAFFAIAHPVFVAAIPDTVTDTASEVKIAKSPVFENVFSSQVADDYFTQLQEFMREEESKYSLDAVEHFFEGKEEFKSSLSLLKLLKQQTAQLTTAEKQTYHEHLILELRKSIELRNANLQLEDQVLKIFSDFIDDLTFWMYTAPQLNGSFDAFLKEYLPEAYTPEQMNQELGGFLINMRNVIKSKSSFVGSESPDLYDAHRHGDLPSYLFSVTLNGKTTKVIRTPNTTYDLSFDEQTNAFDTQLIPEFANYLKVLARQGKTHLYINNLNRNSHHRHNESEIIEGMENDLQFASDVSVVSLNRNSDFFNQKGQFEEVNEASLFKTAFLQELFAEDHLSNYYWSKNLDSEQWKKTVNAIIEDIHEAYFNSQSILSKSERMQFIDIVYTKMIVFLIQILQPDVINISCAVTVDRGPTAYSLLYCELLKLSGRIVENEEIEKVAMMLNSPSLIMRNRPIDNTRLNRFIASFEKLNQIESKMPSCDILVE